MEKTITDLGDCKKEMKIIFTRDEIQEQIDKAYLKLLPNINIKGFRKGKVPLNVVKRMYGKEIEEDSLNEYAVEFFNNYIKENQVKIIGEPSIQSIDKDENGATVTYHFFQYPEFELLEYKGLQILEPIHSVTEEEIDKKIEQICFANGRFEDVQTVEDENCILKLKLDELDKETLVPIVGKTQETHIYLKSETVIKELKESLIGKSLGDSIVFNPHQYENTSPDTTYNITITEIRKNIPIELDSQFIMKYTQDRLSTLEELREEIGYKIQDEWNEKSKQRMEDQIIDQLSTMHEFDVPQHLVYTTAYKLAADTLGIKKNDKQIDQEKLFAVAKDLEPFAKKIVKWNFIKEKIAEKENIEVEDYDLETLADKYFPNMDSKSAIEKIKKNDNVVNQLLETKVLDFLLDFAITTESTFEDLEKAHSHSDEEHDHTHEHSDEHCDDPTHHHEIETFDQEVSTEESNEINDETKETDK